MNNTLYLQISILVSIRVIATVVESPIQYLL